MSLPAALQAWHAPLEARLADRLPLSTLAGTMALNDAVRYAVFPGGRRWRPVLTLLGAMTAGVRPETVIDVACGVEYVHSASLILDDLPAMDDGRERRGRPTVHRAFGEGAALLAALALLNRGYELFLDGGAGDTPGSPEYRLLREAMSAIGADGMIGGQAADLAGHHAAHLGSRQRKTTALVRLAAVAGAIAGGAADPDIEALGTYGACIGAAYQIHDDLLDADARASAAGKTAGQDARHGRPSWSGLTGVDAACTAAALEIDRGRLAISRRFGETPAARLLIAAAGEILDSITGPLVPGDGR